MNRYLTGAARFHGDHLIELVLFCRDDPDEEMQEGGFLHENFVAGVDQVIQWLKNGTELVACFPGTDKCWPVEVVNRDGKETLEVMQLGQPELYRTLANLRELPESY